MADITSARNLNPARRHRSYPRVVRRARHNSYRVKRPADTGTRYHGPPTIRLVNLPATVMVESAWGAVPGLLLARFPRPLAAPGVPVSRHRALHGLCRQAWSGTQGLGILLPR